MKILLDAYFDNNFGDDLFIDTLLGRYPQARFYVFWKKAHPQVLERARQFQNLIIMPGNCELQWTLRFDGYIMIGGDVLPDGIDYSERVAWMSHVKGNGGFVAMLGFSLYKTYGEKTRTDLHTMAMLADAIVIRDHYSAKRFQGLVPDVAVVESTDMAFAREYGNLGEKKIILGIAPRRKLYSMDEEHTAYCKGIASVANKWLKIHRTGKVRFLAFSTGEYDDNVTVNDIRSYMDEKNRTELFTYADNISEFLKNIQECSALLPTRFHALVLALIYDISFVPIPYEVKMTQLLDEVSYSGIRLPYGRSFSEDMVIQTLQELECKLVDSEAMEKYQRKSEKFFVDLDALMKEKSVHEERGSFLCQRQIAKEIEQLKIENQHLKDQNLYLKKQEKELTDWVNSLKKERLAFETQNQELDAIRLKQWEQLVQITNDYAALDEKYQELLNRR